MSAQGTEQQGEAPAPAAVAKFGVFDLAGQDLVMKILSATEVDEILSVEDMKPTDMVTELQAIAIHSLGGRVWPREVDGIAKLRAQSQHMRDMIAAAYEHLHNITRDDVRFMRKSKLAGLAAGLEAGLVSYAEPVPQIDNEGRATGKLVEGERFVLRELTAGHIDDALSLALDGQSMVSITNNLCVDSLERIGCLLIDGVVTGGTESMKGPKGVRWLGALSNRQRTIYSMAYTLLHDATRKQKRDFLAGCVLATTAPKAH